MIRLRKAAIHPKYSAMQPPVYTVRPEPIADWSVWIYLQNTMLKTLVNQTYDPTVKTARRHTT